MKKTLYNLRDTLIAGFIFLLPLLILFVVLTKVFQVLTGITSKIAGLFGLKSIMGISGGTIIGGIGMVLLCLLCGYLFRIAFFKRINRWLDDKLTKHIPGYAMYRQMAISKVDKTEKPLPYKNAAWAIINGVQQPCFVVEKMPDGKYVLFFPVAGNVKEGNIYLLTADKIEILPQADMKAFQTAIADLGVGLTKQTMEQTQTV